VKSHQPKNPEESSSRKEGEESRHVHFKGESKESKWGKYLVAHYRSGFQFPKISFVVPYMGVENRPLF